MKRRILSLLLAFVMMLGMLPISAMASETEYVYLSVSFDAGYIDDINGNPIVYRPVPLDEIAAIDLVEYGLDNMLYDADGDEIYETTALQLLIYAHEKLYGGNWSEVNFDALPGSSYFSGGIFGFTENLVYFQNGDFPVDESQNSDYMTTGATSDRIVLKAGDFIDVASFGCYQFLWDEQGGFHLFADPEGNYVHDYAATAGEPLSVKLKHSFCDLMYGQSWVKEAAEYPVYYGAVFGEGEGTVITDENGNARITFPTAGTYYVWCEGGRGGSGEYYDPHMACGCETDEEGNTLYCYVSSPAYAKVIVTGDTGSTQPNPDQAAADAVAEKIAAIGVVSLAGESSITAARAAYDALSEAQKELVENYALLTAAETALAGLKAAADQAAADAVEEKIAAIGVVSLTGESAITAARTAYDALSDVQKALVENFALLTAAETALSAIKAAGQPQDVSAVLDATLTKLSATVTQPSFGTNYGEWTVFSLARGNYFAKDSKYFADYYDRILGTVFLTAGKVNKTGALDANKSTDNSRLIMALSSIGIDSTAVGKVDLVEAYSANGLNWIRKQGLNGTIWALIALDTGNYKTSDSTLRQQCVDSILNAQHDDGGWSLVTAKTQPSNVDITGMTLTALYPYRDQPAVAAACAEAFVWLSESQLANGGFPYGEGETSESCVWAIVACTEWGINPDTDPRFIKNGQSAIDNLLSYYLEDDAVFEHIRGAGANAMATDQASYALVAYDRFINGENALYDMRDVVITKSDKQVIRVESVTVSPAEITLNIGETANLTTVITPSNANIKDVKWKSSDKKVASVVAATGKVTAKAEGTAVITVTTEDGSKTATCTVTVVNADKEAAASVSALIAAIGNVSLDRKPAITAARAAYDALSDGQKALVENYAVLTAAEAALEALETPSTPSTPEKKTITVTMRLIGAELSTQDVDLSETAYLPSYVTWIPTTAYTLDKGATVYDLWVAATADAGIDSIGANKDYVETVYSPFGGYDLSEFTNGARSGWMYTIDGKHPGFGLCYQTLQDGDTVIWHYINDYAWEVEDWSSIGGTSWPQLSTNDNNYWNRWLQAPDVYGGKGGALTVSSGAAGGEVLPEQENENKEGDGLFSDVKESDYFYDAVVWAVEAGITKGTDAASFSPNASCTRAQMVTFLWRAAGCPKAVSDPGTFTDVDKDAYYYEALLWALENGITKGTGEMAFGPDDACTRAQMAAFLYRNAKSPAVDGNHTFSDVEADTYYSDAVLWAAAEGITTGTGESTFSPVADCTRAQMVTFLFRYLAK